MQATGGPAWDLYIQALDAFQKVPENNQTSYFQVVGIHGLPFQSWNGVGNVNGGAAGGYCPHNEVLFATWHRPFLALFEQLLVKHAQAIAQKYPSSTRAKYVDAARTLRIPYWDWAQDPSLPPSTTAKTISVTTPTGKKTINNPLYSYKFQKFPFTYANFGGTLGRYPETIRCPSSTSSSATSRFNVVNANLARDASYLKNSVYLTFTRTNSFAVMATDGQGGYTFEAPHNTVHNDVGCSNPSGHMTNLGWSAFDPIFMLHHANVDRLIAMWQASHPSSQMFTGSYRTSSAMYGTARGTTYTADYPLKPFYQTETVVWTSANSASTRNLGYTYPEVQDWKMSATDLQRSVVAAVNSLYGTSATRAKRSIESRADDTVLQYMAEISVDREDLELPCTINMYLEDNLAGTFTLLSMPKVGPSFGNIPLQEPLAQFKADATESPQNTVVRLLKSALRVEMVTADGTTKSILNVPSLKVDLEVSEVQPAKSDYEFPTYLNTTKVAVKLGELL
ncbi:common central domain of tyrosinase domain-containing protein [Sarocladium implicatum]|nr:common central domain of tyrosinase domain-containing protein [Sarocladium implicatum]